MFIEGTPNTSLFYELITGLRGFVCLEVFLLLLNNVGANIFKESSTTFPTKIGKNFSTRSCYSRASRFLELIKSCPEGLGNEAGLLFPASGVIPRAGKLGPVGICA